MKQERTEQVTRQCLRLQRASSLLTPFYLASLGHSLETENLGNRPDIKRLIVTSILMQILR